MNYNARHPPTKEEAAVARWAARDIAHTHTRESAKLREIKEGEEKVLVLTLSSDLAMKFQRALSMGRQHRLSAHYTKAKLKETRTERLDNAALVETLEFELRLKKMEIEQALVPSDKQREELSTLARGFHRMRNKNDVIEKNLITLEEGDQREVERWRDAWFEVDKLLDNVWMEAGILKQYESTGEDRTERPAATPGHRSGRERGLAGGQESIALSQDVEGGRKTSHVEDTDVKTGRELWTTAMRLTSEMVAPIKKTEIAIGVVRLLTAKQGRNELYESNGLLGKSVRILNAEEEAAQDYARDKLQLNEEKPDKEGGILRG
ncbi:uncharacterized protein J4E84_010643 [Alternaria hordeiaustralica]|uniref:uncharacterized protein n=1 Tax=Alternaria hordeiaustralica TaxID=1187925 RepID=UPI0020C2603D|nr:uncharacterized protein J4E84_010643 [Alternaria hordeiaustralica]KAI4674268.1 hypothetical protein J4E84_010643 [Alternaria hordeiaustralica]